MTENYPEALATNASPVARTAIVVLGAGSGTRLKEKMPKAAVDVHGKTLLYWALERARTSCIAERIVVTVPTDCAHRCPQLLTDATEFDALVTEGGNTRTASVIAALDALAAEKSSIERVLIHDCARAFTPPQVFRTVAQALTAGHRAVIPVVPVIDTIKTVDAHGTVTGTPSRALMRAVQTPQGFRLDTLRAAHEHSRTLEASVAEQITDDAMAVEAYGEQVHTVTGHTDAFKITTPLDLRIARALYPTAPESACS